MKVEYKASELFTVTAEGNTHTELWSNLAGLAEVFGVEKCGMCGSHELLPIKRVVDDVSHYELTCKKCRARLTLAQNKTGSSLYPRRKYHKLQSEVQAGRAKVDDYIPNNGWEKWVPEDNTQPSKKGK